jgi:cell division protein FtsW (lipid II flippase)
MQEDNITQQQSLDIIESMINKAKNQFSENGFVYLLWGWVILVCSISQFILRSLNYPKHYLVWMLTWLALIVQVVYYAKRKKRKTVKTYTDDIIGYVWMTFVIMLLLCGAFVSRQLQPQQYYIANITILVLYGMPTFLSGVILKFRPLVVGGICCWILAVAAGFLPHDLIILLLAVAVITAWIIPGYLLRSRYKKQNLQSWKHNK